MKEKPTILIQNDRLRIRKTIKEDMILKVKWYNDPDVNRTLILPEALELQKTYAWFERTKDDPTRADWFIETRENVPIGVIGYRNINLNNKSGLLYTVIGEKDYWGKGLGLDAECLAIHYGFRKMNLRKILGNALENNSRSIHVCEKIGFVQEGLIRDDYYHDGKYYDVYRLGLFQDEFYKKHPEYKDMNTNVV